MVALALLPDSNRRGCPRQIAGVRLVARRVELWGSGRVVLARMTSDYETSIRPIDTIEGPLDDRRDCGNDNLLPPPLPELGATPRTLEEGSRGN